MASATVSCTWHVRAYTYVDVNTGRHLGRLALTRTDEARDLVERQIARDAI